MSAFETKRLSENYGYLALDKSEVRLLPNMKGGGLAHCTLPPGGVSLADVHKTVQEIRYFLRGQGEVWRKQENHDEVVDVEAGVSLTIPQHPVRSHCVLS